VSIFAGKFAGYVVTTLSLALPSGVLAFFILLSARGFAGVPPAVGDLLQTWASWRSPSSPTGALRPAGRPAEAAGDPGLLFLYGWELMANLPGTSRGSR